MIVNVSTGLFGPLFLPISTGTPNIIFFEYLIWDFGVGGVVVVYPSRFRVVAILFALVDGFAKLIDQANRIGL